MEKPVLQATVPKNAGKKGQFYWLDFSNVQLIMDWGLLFVKLGVLAGPAVSVYWSFGVNSHYRDVFQLTGLEQVIKGL